LGGVASIVIRLAPQYSVSFGSSMTSPVDESVETSLHFLHCIRSSHDDAAHARKMNKAAKRIFLFILVLFRSKIINYSSIERITIKKVAFIFFY
jgi:hypothetical protein